MISKMEHPLELQMVTHVRFKLYILYFLITVISEKKSELSTFVIQLSPNLQGQYCIPLPPFGYIN